MIYESARDLFHRCGGWDCLIVDPPYSAHVHDSAVSNNPGGIETGTHKREFGFGSLDSDLLSTLLDAAALTPRWTCVFTDIESAGSVWQPGLDSLYVRAVPWVRWSQPQKSGDRPGSGCEIVCCAHGPGRKLWNGPGSLTHFAERCLRGREKHPTEKPLDLMLSLVSWFSAPGERVIDPCCGSGTTGLACRLLGRDFAGAEADGSWREHATRRLEAGLSDRDLTRAREWVATALAREEREVIVTPKAIERRDRRLADIETVAKAVGNG